MLANESASFGLISPSRNSLNIIDNNRNNAFNNGSNQRNDVLNNQGNQKNDILNIIPKFKYNF